MSFWDHLEQLRWVLFRVLGAFAVMTIVAFLAMPYIFDDFILGPTTGDFFIYRWLSLMTGKHVAADSTFAVQLININVASQFMTHVNTSLLLAVVATFPYLAYELWRYVRPALYSHEARPVRWAFLGGTGMFYLGCAIGYAIIFPATFRFLAEYQLSDAITNQFNLQSYIHSFMSMIFIMGLMFEMPLLAALLGRLGLLRRAFLQRYRRHAIVVLLVLAAFITPSGDPFTLMLVFMPLYALYEVSIRVVKK